MRLCKEKQPSLVLVGVKKKIGKEKDSFLFVHLNVKQRFGKFPTTKMHSSDSVTCRNVMGDGGRRAGRETGGRGDPPMPGPLMAGA